MGELAVAYPQTFRLEYDAGEAVKPLTQSERIKYGYPELIRQERQANERMNRLRSMLYAYGYPSTEFGILWDRMEKRALEEKTALDDKEQFKKSDMIMDSASPCRLVAFWQNKVNCLSYRMIISYGLFSTRKQANGVTTFTT